MDFDLLVIGSGPAGTSAIEAAAELGVKRMAVVEAEKRLGGECPNTGCVPTKSLLRSIEVLRLARRAAEFGLDIPTVKANFGAMLKRKDMIVDMATGRGRMERIFKNLGATLIRGRAVFVDPNTVEIKGRRITASKFIVATGSVNVIPPIPGLAEAGYLTFENLVEIDRVPTSMVIVGGGPIGCEWAQILAPLGCKVAIVEFMEHLLPREEEETAEVVRNSFMSQGIAVFPSHKTTRVLKKGGAYEVTIQSVAEGKSKLLKTHAVMVATGQRPTVDGLGLEAAGVKLDAKNRPVVNEYLQTTNPNVYFAGDASGAMMFTHTAHEEGNISVKNAMNGNTIKRDLRVIPRVTFVFPEVASVGLTEKEARVAGHNIAVGRTSYSGISKPFLAGERDGVVKLVIDRKSKQILGGHIVGHSAGEMIHEIALAMYANLPVTTVADMVHAYPTLAEAVGVAAYDAVEELKKPG